MRLVDRSLWIEFLRRKGDTRVKRFVARWLESETAASTFPIRFELLSGGKPDEDADVAQALEFGLHLPFEGDDWRAAAVLERELRAKGLTIPRNDLFVATVAIRPKLPVACRAPISTRSASSWACGSAWRNSSARTGSIAALHCPGHGPRYCPRSLTSRAFPHPTPPRIHQILK